MKNTVFPSAEHSHGASQSRPSYYLRQGLVLNLGAQGFS